MRVRYLAHPVRPLQGETIEGNVARAMRWYRWARVRWPEDVIVCQWLLDLHAKTDDDADPRQREAGLRRCEVQVARCDELILCGGRISSGMARERKVADYEGINVVDMSELVEPPRSEA